jgi:hypothetical protein
MLATRTALLNGLFLLATLLAALLLLTPLLRALLIFALLGVVLVFFGFVCHLNPPLCFEIRCAVDEGGARLPIIHPQKKWDYHQ